MPPVLVLMAAEHEPALVDPPLAHAVEHLHFSFETGLLALSCLLVVSILTEKVGLRMGIPGSIFLCFAGLFRTYLDLALKAFRLKRFMWLL